MRSTILHRLEFLQRPSTQYTLSRAQTRSLLNLQDSLSHITIVTSRTFLQSHAISPWLRVICPAFKSYGFGASRTEDSNESKLSQIHGPSSHAKSRGRLFRRCPGFPQLLWNFSLRGKRRMPLVSRHKPTWLSYRISCYHTTTRKSKCPLQNVTLFSRLSYPQAKCG